MELQVSVAFDWFKAHMFDLLTSDGSFTVFLPDDKAFNSAFNESKEAISEYLNDTDRSFHLMMQHILIGKYTLEELGNYREFYTLAGNYLKVNQINSAANNTEYQLSLNSGFSKSKITAKVTNKNLEASNGMIHVLRALLKTEPNIKGNSEDSAMQLMQKASEYQDFANLVKVASKEEFFNQPNIMVFVPESRALTKLPTGALSYLKNTEEGTAKLKVLIMNHIVPNQYNAFHLVQTPSVISSAHINISISVTNQGRIQLGNYKANVTQFNIPCRNGFVYTVDRLLVPQFLQPVLPNIFNHSEDEHTVLTEKCGPCPKRERCSNDINYKFLRIQRCTLPGNNDDNVLQLRDGCQVVCNPKAKPNRCRSGFYGPNCWPCPGEVGKPCHSQGRCDDLDTGTGTCSCNESFSGFACEKCKDDSMHGPNCSITCKCLHGVCDNGPTGTGMCKAGSCLDGYGGDLCDLRVTRCPGPIYFPLCPINSHPQCFDHAGEFPLEKRYKFQCKCKRGYEIDGIKCVFRGLCHLNGGCHSQAGCEVLPSGTKAKCTCSQGWRGDGLYCAPVSKCMENKKLCGSGLQCYDLEPGQYECVKPDPCSIDNGGCHQNAVCSLNSLGHISCTCPRGYGGNGKICYGTIEDEVAKHANLTYLAKILERNVYAQKILSNSDSITFLAPSDEAMWRKWVPIMQTNIVDSDFIVKVVEFHTLLNGYTFEDIQFNSRATNEKYPTFFDGFSVHMASTNESVHIFSRRKDLGQFVIADIPATNGYIHIIDGILLPFLPDVKPRDLRVTMLSDKRLSIFDQVCNRYNFFEEVDAYNEFTIFAPINTAIARTAWSENYLAMYRFPVIILTPSIINGDTDYDHLNLKFVIRGDNVFVNNVRIVNSDILVKGGVLHVIDGLLHFPHGRCADQPSPQCCDGFFGQECQKCPECGDRSHCNDGINGDGVCYCWPGFKPPLCQDCQNPNMTGAFCDVYVTECGVNSYSNCSGNNNSNSNSFYCVVATSGGKCRCPDDRIIPGDECMSLCLKELGHHCHQQASCVRDDRSNYSCQCIEDYTGDGVNECVLRNQTECGINNGRCDTEDRAVCTFLTDTMQSNDVGKEEHKSKNVSCKCVDGYVGDGYLCSTSLMDAVSRIPQLKYFWKYLMSSKNDKNNSSSFAEMLLGEGNISTVTLFLPVDDGWSSLQLNGLALAGYYYLDQLSTPNDHVLFSGIDGEVLLIEYRDDGRIYVNDVLVVRMNIPALNGIIHLTATPVTLTTLLIVDSSTQPSWSSPSSLSSAKPTTIIIASIAGAILFIGLFVVAVVICRKMSRSHSSCSSCCCRTSSGFKFKFLKSSECSQRDASSEISFIQLQANDRDRDDESFLVLQ